MYVITFNRMRVSDDGFPKISFARAANRAPYRARRVQSTRQVFFFFWFAMLSSKRIYFSYSIYSNTALMAGCAPKSRTIHTAGAA